MAVTRFYNTKNATALNKDGRLDSGDLYIQKFEFEGQCVLDSTTPTAATLTPSDTVTWSADDFNSTGNYNLLIVDDNSVVAKVKVTDTTAGTNPYVTIDTTAAILESDESTAPTLTNGSTYDVRILTPCSSSDENGGVYGKFIGYISELSISNTEEIAVFKYGIPRDRKWEETVENVLTGSFNTLMVTDEDTIEAVYNAAEYGSNTGKWSRAYGTNNGSRSYYRLTLVASDINNRTCTEVYWKCRLKQNGDVSKFDENFKMIPISVTMFGDSFYPEDASLCKLTRDN